MTLTPLAYQLEDAEWLSTKPRALLGSDPGTGKSMVAIRAMEDAGHCHVLLVCPAIARNVWVTEMRKWAREPWVVHRVNQPSDPMPLETGVRTLVIIGYDMFSRKEKGEHSRIYDRIFTNVRNPLFDLLVCDEAHYLKELTSNRTREVYGLVKNGKAGNVWLLTGTPAPNHYGELYPHFRYVWPKLISNSKGEIMSREQFENTFCDVRTFKMNGHDIRSIVGSKGGATIKQMLTGVMSRRKFSDVVKDLPVIRIEPLILTAPKTGIPLAGVAQGISVFLKGTPQDDDEVLRKLNQLAKDPTVAASRRELGKLKVDLLIDHVSDLLDNDPRAKLLIGAWHHEVLDRIVDKYARWNPVNVDGRTPDYRRTEVVAKFQNDPKTRILVGQILAAGTAITLTAAHDVLFVESSWVPGENYQFAMRCQRLGQKNGVLARHACVEGTYDVKIMEILARKETGLAEVFG